MAQVESFKIELLDTENWGAWRKKMKVSLRANDLWGIVAGSEQEPVGPGADTDV